MADHKPLIPSTSALRPLADSHDSSRSFFLSDVRVEIPNTTTAIFLAKLNGPSGAHVWARAWLSNEIDGTLAETESQRLCAGDQVTLTVVLRDSRIPEIACIRIESAPLKTEQVVIIKLPCE
ncbi:MAG TPA: hypothetical protein VMB80_18815 [Candidatus Acidoferrum sp.]|nr:hypothetical protein [Candidatus Acidoferrum sp.]